MAFDYKRGINIASGFKLQSPKPIDTRFTVDLKTDLDELVQKNAVYSGLLVYCDEDGLTYKYAKDGEWNAIDSLDSLQETLDKYLPLAGGTMTGPVVWDGATDEALDVTQGATEDGYTVSATTEDGKTHKDTITNTADREISVEGANSKSTVKITDEMVSISTGAKDDTAEDPETMKSIVFGHRIKDGADFTAKNTVITMGARNIELKAGTNFELGILEDYAKITFTPATIELGQAATIVALDDGDLLTIKKVKAELEGNADTATKLAKAVNVSVAGAVTSTISTFDGSSDLTINAISVDATMLTGVIPLACIPKGAQERLVTVTDLDAMYALTTEEVQLGDVVRIVDADGNVGSMYYVIDEDKLDSADGYAEFSAGAASSVPVAGVEGLNTWLVSFFANSANGIGDMYATKFIGDLQGNADTATKLAAAVNVTMSGAVTATATTFDGSDDLDLEVTAVSTSALFVPDGDVLILDGNA